MGFGTVSRQEARSYFHKPPFVHVPPETVGVFIPQIESR